MYNMNISQIFFLIGAVFLAAGAIVFAVSAWLSKKLGKDGSLEDDMKEHLLARPPATPERKRVLTLRKIALLLILLAFVFATVGRAVGNPKNIGGGGYR
jgi:small neutral amino acid transporter SnatA (MarC family)